VHEGAAIEFLTNETMSPALVNVPYLLALFGVAVYEVGGDRYLDSLWAQDLRRHAGYIPQLTVFCYIDYQMPAQATRIGDCPVLSRVQYVLVDKPRNMLHGLWMLPGTLRALHRATRDKVVVHSGVAGWPFPSAWLLLPMQDNRRSLSVIVVESAFWRSSPSTISRRAWRALSERLNAYCLKRAGLPIFTTSGYRRSLLGSRPALVCPAAWVQEKDILLDEQIEGIAETRSRGPALRLVFAGRLTEEKGVRWLVESLSKQPFPGGIHLDLFGAGPLEQWLHAAQVDKPDLCIRFRGTLPYGEPLFRTLREYDALILPTLSDEQPRILFDAYSQGLPVIASQTEGTADYVTEGVHGTAFRIGDEESFFAAVSRFKSLRARWPQMARNCIATARTSTHESMHCVRADAINSALQLLTVK
jgi:glycosyltransferase involved in cell wall biosynthesis